MLPSFVGIGAARCGSTWLDAVLRTHENILVPKATKEVRYFNEYYHRGQGWYESFFDRRCSAAIVGEVTITLLLIMFLEKFTAWERDDPRSSSQEAVFEY